MNTTTINNGTTPIASQRLTHYNPEVEQRVQGWLASGQLVAWIPIFRQENFPDVPPQILKFADRHQQLAAAKAELARQNVAMSVLVQVLIERGVVDGAQLKARFDQAMSQAQAAANMVSCARCRRQVDKRATQITSSGGMCDACYRALMTDDE